MVLQYYALLYSIFATLSQAPNRPPLVVAAGQGQLATVQQLIKDGVGSLENCDEVPVVPLHGFCHHTLVHVCYAVS